MGQGTHSSAYEVTQGDSQVSYKSNTKNDKVLGWNRIGYECWDIMYTWTNLNKIYRI